MLTARRSSYGLLRSVLLVGSALSLLPGAVLAAEESKGGLETIVVTAQKRAENLQIVPVAVTAFTAKALQDIHYENIKNLDSIAPGVAVREGAGGQQTGQFSMRGVYGQNSYASDAGVALYVDGIYVPATAGDEFDLADIERIEVLRGPQGTLFGRNAIGGAVNIITREPSGEFHVHQDLAAGNLAQFKSRTSIDLPAWGLLSASVSYLHDEADGGVRNLGAGTVWDYTAASGGKVGKLVSPSTLGNHNTNGVAAAVKFETESGIKVVYRFDYTHKDFSPDAVGINQFPLLTGGALAESFWAQQPASFRTPVTGTSRPDAVNNWYSTEGVARNLDHTLTVSIPITEGVTFKDLFGYRSNHVEATNQLTGLGGITEGEVFTALGVPAAFQPYPPGTPFNTIENDTESRSNTESNETQINVDNKWITATLGYLYFHSKDDEGSIPGAINTAVFTGLSACSPPYLNFAAPVLPVPSTCFPYGVTHDLVHQISHAVYNQDEVHVLPKLDVVGGFRYTHDKKAGIDGAPAPAAAPTMIHYSRGQWTYLAGLNYKLSDQIFLYAKYSTGYISGGQLANIQFQPETSKSWEGGIKADWLDQTLRTNFAIFTVKYGNLQELTTPQVPGEGCYNVPGVSHTASQCIVNGGTQQTDGFELELTYTPPAVPGLTLTGNTAYNHNYFTYVVNSLRAADGSFVPQYVPAWTADIAVNYHGPVWIGTAYPIFRLETNYQSSVYTGYALLRPILNTTQTPARWLLDGRLGLGGIKIGGVDTELSVYGQNLTNNRSMQYSADLGVVIDGQYVPARTYGIELNASF